jgi:hypothetical protein
MSTRPLQIPLLATAPGFRATPFAATLTQGFGTEVFLAPHANWLIGYGGDWAVHLDASRGSLIEEWDDRGFVSLVAGELTFLVGGALAQRPVTGGIYIGRKCRLDALVQGADAPVFTFTANATNHVYMAPSTTRSAYPDVVINTTGISPGALYREVRTVTTGPATVTIDSPPVGQLQGWYIKGRQNITGQGTDTTFQVEIVDSANAGIIFSNVTALNVNTMVLWQPNDGQLSSFTLPLGVGTAGHEVSLNNTGITAYRAKSLLNTVDNAAYEVDTPLLGHTWAVAMKPHSAVPGNGANFTAFTRLFSTIQTFSGGFRWRDAGASGYPWTPHAHRGASTTAIRATSGDQTLAGAVAITTLHTSAAFELLTGHSYLIHVECEALASVTKAFLQTVTIDINGVADADWSTRQLNSDTTTALSSPWISTTILYQHAAADTTGAVRLRVAHSAGAGSVTYTRPRISVLGPFSA